MVFIYRNNFFFTINLYDYCHGNEKYVKNETNDFFPNKIILSDVAACSDSCVILVSDDWRVFFFVHSFMQTVLSSGIISLGKSFLTFFTYVMILCARTNSKNHTKCPMKTKIRSL